jgi:hypothetical protein
MNACHATHAWHWQKRVMEATSAMVALTLAPAASRNWGGQELGPTAARIRSIGASGPRQESADRGP